MSIRLFCVCHWCFATVSLQCEVYVLFAIVLDTPHGFTPPVCSSMLCCHIIREAWHSIARHHDWESYFTLFGMAFYWTCCLRLCLRHYDQRSGFRFRSCLYFMPLAILFSMRLLILTALYCLHVSHAVVLGACTSVDIHDPYASILWRCLHMWQLWLVSLLLSANAWCAQCRSLLSAGARLWVPGKPLQARPAHLSLWRYSAHRLAACQHEAEGPDEQTTRTAQVRRLAVSAAMGAGYGVRLRS